MKHTSMLFSTFVLLFFLVACSQPTNTVSVNDDQGTIKIGISAPLSGDVSFMGEAMQNALIIAREDMGETKYHYEIIFEDDRLDAKTASTVAQKLINVDDVDVLMSVSSGTGNVVSSIADQNRILHFGIATDPAVANGKYNFIHWTPPSEEAKAWVSEAKKREYRTIAIVVLNHQGALAIIEALKKELQDSDITIVSEQIINTGDVDFKTVILKAKQSAPDAYFILAFSPELDILYTQMLSSGIAEPITSIEGFELSDDPALFEGQWFTNAGEPDPVFSKKYDELFPGVTNFAAGNTYDIFNMLVDAYETVGANLDRKPTADEIADYLLGVKNFNGTMGSLNIGEEGIVFSPASVNMIQNGKSVVIG